MFCYNRDKSKFGELIGGQYMKRKGTLIGLSGLVILVSVLFIVTVIKPFENEEAVEPVVNEEQDEIVEVVEEPDVVVEPVEKIEEEAPEILIEADLVTDYGVDVKSSFTLTHYEEVSVDNLLNNLKVTPEQTFTVKQLQGKTYQISFDEELPNKTNVKFKYSHDDQLFGYGFQTYEPFEIVDSYPASGSTYVDVKTGIEIEFTRQVDESIMDYITIEPEITFTTKYSREGMLLQIIPNSPLEKNTEYTVTVDQSYSVLEDTLPETFTMDFLTSEYSGNTNIVIGNSNLDTIGYEGEQVIPIAMYSTNRDSLTFQVYRINSESVETFIQTRDYHKRLSLVEEGKAEYVGAYESDVIELDWYSYGAILKEKLDKGHYFIVLEEPIGVGGIIQVTDYSGYLTMDKDEVFVWLQHPERSAEGLNLYLGEQFIGTTDSQGALSTALVIETTDYAYFRVETGEEELFMPTRIYDDYDYSTYHYYSYLYTDRPIYLPTDTINIYGFVKERTVGPVENVEVRLMYQDEIIESQMATLEQGNGYSVSFELDNYQNSYASIEVYNGDQLVDSEWIEVTEFEKPLYKVNIDVDKDYVMTGDMVNLTGNIQYYDGTKVKDGSVKVNLRSNGYENAETWYDAEGTRRGVKVYESEDGSFNEDYQVISKSSSWRPTYMSAWIEAQEIQDFYVTDGDGFYIFAKDMMLEIEEEPVDNNLVVTGLMSYIDISKIENRPWDADEFRGDMVPEHEVSVSVVEEYWEAYFVEQRYNALYKVTYDVYRYERRSETILDTQVVTDENGQFQVIIPDYVEDHTYKILTSTYDGQDSLMEQEDWLYAYQDRSDTMVYKLANRERNLEVGESVQLELLLGGRAIVSDQDKMLVLEAKDGIKNYEIVDTTTYDYTFEFDSMPDTKLIVIYFNGSRMVSNWEMSQTLYVDEESRTLDVEVSLDKEVYYPGDEVAFEIQVKDPDGNPVQANVNISVVDEKVFAIMDDYSDPVWSLCSYNFYDGIIGTFLMSPEFGMFGGAEGGGEGGPEAPRDDFENTAYFDTIQTNLQGQYKGTYTLPDNLTEWRMTVTSITEDIYASKEKIQYVTTMPLFMNARVESKYLSGDDINLVINTGGIENLYDETIVYSMELMNSQGDVIRTEATEARFGDYVYLPVGTLEAGEYSVTIRTETLDGTYYDWVTKSFLVLDQIAYYTQEKVEVLGSDTSIEANGQYASISIFNEAAYEYYSQINCLTYLDNDKSFVRNLTGKIAKNFVNEVFFDKAIETYSLWPYTDGFLVKELANSSGKRYATARLFKIGLLDYAEYYDESSLIEAMNGKIEDAKTIYADYIYALWINQMLGENQYAEIREVEENYDTLTGIETKLAAIRVALEIGDISFANTALNQLLIDENIDLTLAIRQLHTDKAKDELLLLSLLAITTDLERFDEAENLVEYYSNYYYLHGKIGFEHYAPEPELYYYLVNKERPVIDAQFTYLMNGETHQVALEFFQIFRETLTPEEADSFQILSYEGELNVIKNNVVQVDNMDVSEAIPMQRAIRNMTDPGNPISVGDKVKVTLTINKVADDYRFTIQDPLPAGLNFLELQKTSDSFYLFGNPLSDMVELWAGIRYDIRESYSSVTYAYYAIATAPGTYHWEPALMIDNVYGHTYVTDLSEIEIVE